MSSDWQCEEVDAFSETKEDEECMLTEFDCCNSKNQSSSVADADTLWNKRRLWQQEWECRRIDSMIASASCLLLAVNLYVS
jgi:hypothetical protein